MRFSDSELIGYVSGKLALPGLERNEHRQQVGRLIEKLTKVVEEDGSYNIKKFRRAGSLEKGTSNRPRAGKAPDADVGVYFVDDPEQFDIAKLQGLLKRLLVAAYPQKDEADFDDSRSRTFGVVFKGSGLEIDLVPIVSIDDDAIFGLQYSRDGDRIKTSVKVHIDHYRSHANTDSLLAPILRMAKRWVHWQELSGIKSFHLELILSYLIDTRGVATSIEDGLRRFFLFIIRDLKSGVTFNASGKSAHSDPVVILDPANAANNVAARITESEREEFVRAATIAFETLTWAQELPGKTETLGAWRELLGSNFDTG